LQTTWGGRFPPKPGPNARAFGLVSESSLLSALALSNPIFFV